MIKQYLTPEAYEREKSEDMARWERYLLTGNAVDNTKVESWLQEFASKLSQNRLAQPGKPPKMDK